MHRSTLQQHSTFRQTIITAIVTLCSIASVVHAAPLPKGFQILRSDARTFAFTYAPVIESWETVQDGPTTIRKPVIENARVFPRHLAPSVTEWVVAHQIVVPGPTQYTFTPQQNVTVRYEGIGGTTHLASIDVVVATEDHGTIRYTTPITSAITFTSAFVDASTQRKRATEAAQEVERIGKAYRISIQRDGVYRISADELRRNGIATDAAAARTIKIFGRGGMELPERVTQSEFAAMHEQAITVRTNGDGSVRDVIFFGGGPSGFVITRDSLVRHFLHHYSKVSSYVLTVGGTDGKRAEIVPAPSGTVVNTPTTGVGTIMYEEEVVNPYNSGSGRRWFGRSFENGGSITINTLLPGLVRSGMVDYVFSVVSRSTEPGTMTMTENGLAVAQLGLQPNGYYMDAYVLGTTGSIDAPAIPADNRSVLKFAYKSNDRSSTALLDFFEIQYPRSLAAIDNAFAFATGKGLSGVTQYDVNGFSGDIFGYDVTDRVDPVRIENVATTGGMFSVRCALNATSQRLYHLSAALQDVSLSEMAIVNLRADARNVPLVIVTNSALRKSADSMLAYRTKTSGMKGVVVTTEEIFNEFSYGMPDPTAIRDFLQHALTTWTVAPKYVFLWGDGHFDYKNISSAAINYVIPYESDEPDGNTNGLYTNTKDDFFTRLVGDDAIPELAIGRLPITSDAVGMQMIDKIRSYEQQSDEGDWRTRITMIADDSPTGEGQVPDGSLHLRQSETLATKYVPETFQDKKIYLVEYPTENVARGRRKPGVTDDMLSTTNTTGELILNWIGHGNPRVWAHENIFVRETTVPMMTNATKNFFLTAATCDFARFDLPDNQSGAEELVLSQIGGAIGVFSASRVVLSQSNAEINQYFYASLFSREADGRFPLLGDVMLNVKKLYNDDNAEKFFLLGDPTMRLLIPDRTVTIDTINQQAMGDSDVVNLESKATVTVKGFVTKLGSKDIDTSFSGVITISLYDSQVQLTVTDVDGTISNFTKLGAGLNRSSYNVDHGRFEATFVVPKDIAFSTSRATLYGYASSTTGEHAMGMTSNITVGGVADVEYDDFEGPQMSLYMDSRLFKSGDLVRRNPILIVDLNDKTGVNTTGVGIGHNLEAMFDDGEVIENLTNTFTTSLDNSRAGTAVKQIFGLGPGLHTVRVRAWDVLNYYSEQETLFRIESSNDAAIAEDLMNYPNPFSTSTLITFKHNQPQPFDAHVRIFTVNGDMVYDTKLHVEELQTATIPWNARTNDGMSLSSGVYLCVISMTGSDGSTAILSGSMTLIR